MCCHLPPVLRNATIFLLALFRYTLQGICINSVFIHRCMHFVLLMAVYCIHATTVADCKLVASRFPLLISVSHHITHKRTWTKSVCSNHHESAVTVFLNSTRLRWCWTSRLTFKSYNYPLEWLPWTMFATLYRHLGWFCVQLLLQILAFQEEAAQARTLLLLLPPYVITSMMNVLKYWPLNYDPQNKKRIHSSCCMKALLRYIASSAHLSTRRRDNVQVNSITDNQMAWNTKQERVGTMTH